MTNNSLINNMTLISYVKTATNKWLLISESHGDSNQGYSYPRVAMIRIDVHPAVENPTTVTRFSRSVCVWLLTIHISRGP
jgi:hypothetical protein